MAWSFKLQQTPLPPWRECGAMLTKWKPRRATACEPAAASPPGSPTAHCCCDGAAAPAALARQQQPQEEHLPTSPCSVLATATSLDDALQQAAAWACSTGGACTGAGAGSAASLAQAALRSGGRSPVSLLSRSLEPLRRPASTGRPSPPAAHCWWEPRTVKVVPVRRSGPH